MDQPDHDPILSPALLAEIEAVATSENRSSRDVLRAAVGAILQERREKGSIDAKSALSAREAARRILERRPFNKLPEGMTIRDMMTHRRK